MSNPRPEILHLFTIEASHFDEPWESVYKHAKIEAADECKKQSSLATWKDGWVVVCVDQYDVTYHFEVHGYYLYHTPPDDFM